LILGILIAAISALLLLVIASIITGSRNVSYLYIFFGTFAISFLCMIPYYIVYLVFDSEIVNLIGGIAGLAIFYYLQSIMIKMFFGVEDNSKIYTILIIHFISLCAAIAIIAFGIDFIIYW